MYRECPRRAPCLSALSGRSHQISPAFVSSIPSLTPQRLHFALILDLSGPICFGSVQALCPHYNNFIASLHQAWILHCPQLSSHLLCSFPSQQLIPSSPARYHTTNQLVLVLANLHQHRNQLLKRSLRIWSIFQLSAQNQKLWLASNNMRHLWTKFSSTPNISTRRGTNRQSLISVRWEETYSGRLTIMVFFTIYSSDTFYFHMTECKRWMIVGKEAVPFPSLLLFLPIYF